MHTPAFELLLQEVVALLNSQQAWLAVQRIQQALLKQPSDLALLELKARLHIELQHWRSACNVLQTVLRLSPEQVDAWLNLGVAQQHLGLYPAAQTSFEHAITLAPQRVELYLNLCALLLTQDLNAEALQVCQHAQQQHLQHPLLTLNHSTALLALQRYYEVLELLKEHTLTTELRINRIQAYNAVGAWQAALTDLLALVNHEDEQQQEHLELLVDDLLRHAHYSQLREWLLTLKASDDDKLQLLYACNTSLAQHAQRWRERLRVIEDMQHISCTTQQQIFAYKSAADLQLQRKRFAEAQHHAELACALQADCYRSDHTWFPSEFDACFFYTSHQLNYLRKADWSHYSTMLNEYLPLAHIQLLKQRPLPLDPFNSLYFTWPQWLQHTTAQQAAARVSAFARTIPTPIRTTHTHHSRLRIGYLSADFRNHATSHLIQNLFAYHDRQQFEIFAFSLYKDSPDDPYQQRVKQGCEHYIDLSNLDDAQAAQALADTELDILIDLMGYTQHARPQLLALRLAPLQMGFLGYPGTTGADYIDYIIADPTILPSYLKTYFSEQVLYLPYTYMVTARQPIARVPARSSFGLPQDAFVFCNFNNPIKLEPKLFTCWMEILKQIPNSVLWLLIPDTEVQQQLRQHAEHLSISGERLVFASYLPKAQHLGRLTHADLFLDSFIYNAHTTSVDALWAGVPILTLQGYAFPARVSSSHLQTIGIPELITYSVEEYQQRALHLATHPAELAAVRTQIKLKRLSSPLFDTELFARHLEAGFNMAWERHQQSLPPEHLQVPKLR